MKNEKVVSTQRFTQDQGALLIRLARQSLMTQLGLSVAAEEREAVEAALEADIFNQIRGTFVTLTKGGELRGCIGHLTGIVEVRRSVRQNAVNAGFHDPRFAPLTAMEVPYVAIEISILTEPQPLDYTDAQDLIRRLRPQVDGVILSRKGASATFLPQVWQQLPKPEIFLGQLCLKAGLAAKSWQAGDLEVSTYQVQSFDEQA
jgi:AmmeMemoRadiSam system protein A